MTVWAVAYTSLRRQQDAHARAFNLRAAAVRLGDRAHDRQSQSGAAAGPGLVAAGEPLERARRELGREPGALVGDVDRSGPGSQRDRPRAVAERVVDEV